MKNKIFITSLLSFVAVFQMACDCGGSFWYDEETYDEREYVAARTISPELSLTNDQGLEYEIEWKDDGGKVDYYLEGTATDENYQTIAIRISMTSEEVLDIRLCEIKQFNREFCWESIKESSSISVGQSDCQESEADDSEGQTNLSETCQTDHAIDLSLKPERGLSSLDTGFLYLKGEVAVTERLVTIPAHTECVSTD